MVKRFRRELNKDVQSVAPEAMELLERYHWPGNVRELQSVVKQALLHATGPVIVPDFLSATLKSDERSAENAEISVDWDHLVRDRLAAGSEDLYAEALAAMERHVLTVVLRYTEGNQVQAARILGITRGSLRNKIRSLGIMIGKSVWSDENQSEP